MTKEQILGVLRHILTGLGGILIAKGYMDESMLNDAAGAVVTIIGITWSIISKHKAQ